MPACLRQQMRPASPTRAESARRPGRRSHPARATRRPDRRSRPSHRGQRHRRTQRRRHPEQRAVQLAQRVEVGPVGHSAPTESPPRTETGRAARGRGRVAAGPRRGRSARRPTASASCSSSGMKRPWPSRRAAAGPRTGTPAPPTRAPPARRAAVRPAPAPGAAPRRTASRSVPPAVPAASRSRTRRRPPRAPQAAVRRGPRRSGSANGMPASRMRFLARTRRCAMVAGSTAKASAIAAASTPSTVCSISGVRIDRRDRRVGTDQHQLEPPVGNGGHGVDFGWAVVGFVERVGHPVGVLTSTCRAAGCGPR